MEKYIDQLSSLRTATITGVRAPHKAILLLSIIELIEYGVIDSNHIILSESLNREFARNWVRYVGNSILFKPVIGTPFWHLHNEPFWKLISHNGAVVTKESVSGAKYSVGSLQKNVAYAEIDRDLFELLQSEEARSMFRDLLIAKYLNDKHLQNSDIIQMIITVGVSMLSIAS